MRTDRSLKHVIEISHTGDHYLLKDNRPAEWCKVTFGPAFSKEQGQRRKYRWNSRYIHLGWDSVARHYNFAIRYYFAEEQDAIMFRLRWA